LERNGEPRLAIFSSRPRRDRKLKSATENAKISMLQSRHFKRKDVLIGFARHVLSAMAAVKGRAARTYSVYQPRIALDRPAAMNRGGLLDQCA
jgi:hypothetical protein